MPPPVQGRDITMLTELYTKISHFVGLKLFVLGSQLAGFRIVTMYQPEGNPYIQAVHVAVNETQLNNSMRSYVEQLDQTY
jgi:hypothetical protein